MRQPFGGGKDMNGKTNLKDLSEIIHGCQGIEILVPLRNTHPGGLVRPPIYFLVTSLPG